MISGLAQLTLYQSRLKVSHLFMRLLVLQDIDEFFEKERDWATQYAAAMKEVSAVGSSITSYWINRFCQILVWPRSQDDSLGACHYVHVGQLID